MSEIPPVTQLHFARSEFVRCLTGLSDADGRRRLLPTNSISWMIGHLAMQEQFYWLYFGRGIVLYPNLYELVGTGRPASTPELDVMWATWREITVAADEFLQTLTPAMLTEHLHRDEKESRESIGTMLLRNTYHYWFHNGEAHAVRQQLGHADLPQFVGNMSAALYRPAR